MAPELLDAQFLLISRFRVQVPAGAPIVVKLYGLVHPNGRADWATA